MVLPLVDMPKRKEQIGRGPASPRNTVGIELPLNADVDRLAAKFNMAKRDLTERLLRWFIGAPDEVQQAVVGYVPPAMLPAYLDAIRVHFETVLRRYGTQDVSVIEGPGGEPGTPPGQSQEARNAGEKARSRK